MNYHRVGSTGADDYPVLELVSQSIRETESGFLLVEEDDHYNQTGVVGGPYRSLASLKRAAARRRTRLAVKSGEYERATADYEERMRAEDARIQSEVSMLVAQGINALWAALVHHDPTLLDSRMTEKVGLAILAKLGIEVADPARVSTQCGEPTKRAVPPGIEKIKSPGPACEESGAYRYRSPRGSYSRQVVSWHAGSGPLVFIHGECRRDPGLTSGEGMTLFRAYGPAGSWFQFRDSGTGKVWGYKFV